MRYLADDESRCRGISGAVPCNVCARRLQIALDDPSAMHWYIEAKPTNETCEWIISTPPTNCSALS